MAFIDIERKDVWCIHFWDMSLYEGQQLGTDSDNEELTYVRLHGAAINDIELIATGNIFFSKEEAERALFKAKLAGKKRAAGNRKDEV